MIKVVNFIEEQCVFTCNFSQGNLHHILGLKSEPYNKQKLNLTTNLSFLFLTNFGVLKSSK